MTNVKLKLMFLLLSALLTSEFVRAKPFLNGTTTNSTNNAKNATITFSSYSFNSTTGEFNIPVNANSDTLVVANDDDETPEEMNKNSKTEMEAIVNAEQGRDELILQGKNLKEPAAVLEIQPDDAASFEKQMNISSPLLEDIIDAETDREETLTEQFRSETHFVDVPKFEFLISTKLNSTDQSVGVLNTSDVLKKSDYVELVAVGKPIKVSENNSAYAMPNITGHELENDIEPDTILSMFAGFTDMETLFMACFATLVPLLTVLFATLLIRCICRRWCHRCKDTVVSSESSSSEEKPESPHHQLKSIPETSEGGEPRDEEEGLPSNGSIITMTLKNNHLIVETEERNDITKNGRETKMKYSPDNDGIFVVEVQQSAAYRPNHKSQQNSPPHDPQISTNQALIHRVPEELDGSQARTLNDPDDSERSCKIDKAKALALSCTGLSISDLSMSSLGSHNASYSYGSQIGYEQGPFGYPIYAGYDIPKEDTGDGIIHDSSREPLLCKTPTDPDKPVVTAAIFKQDSIIGNDALQGPGYCIEGSTDGPLLSDVQAREVSLQHLHDQMEKKLENGVAEEVQKKEEKIESPKESPKKSQKKSPKKILSRADSLPVQLEDVPVPIIDKTDPLETITEDESPIKREMLKGKRASLPIIRTEMYDTVKEVFVPMGSPKFEKFSNELSPIDGVFDNSPPMITITEEIESIATSENGSS